MLVTFAILSFNQKCYIKEAILAALSQTYEPLEIIISDDHSTDGTWDEIVRFTETYSGPHTIKINRNSKNLGIVKHIEFIVKFARGEFIVFAPADDVSYPNRTDIIVKAWSRHLPRPTLVCSNARTVDSYGNALGLFFSADRSNCYEKFQNPFEQSINISGAMTGFSREIYLKFPNILTSFYAEDAISFHRAHLLDGVLYIPDILLDYRIHEKGASQTPRNGVFNYFQFFRKYIFEEKERLRQYKFDLNSVYSLDKEDNLHTINKREKNIKILDNIVNKNIICSCLFLLIALQKNNRNISLKDVVKLFLFRILYFYMFTSSISILFTFLVNKRTKD